MGVLVTASAGCLLVIRHEHEHVVVHIGRPDAAATLSLCDSFVLADAVLRGAEVVSAVEVSDAPSGLAVIALAWRRRLASGGWAYGLGALDLAGRCLADGGQMLELPPAAGNVSAHMLGDGPVLWLLHGSSASEAALTVGVPASQGERLHAARAALGPGEVSLLCVAELSGPGSQHALLAQRGNDAQPPRVLSVCAPLRHDGAAAPAAPLAAPARVTALESLAAELTCVTAQWAVRPPELDGRVRGELRLWAGTRAAMLHCVGCAGEQVPLRSVRLDAPSQRVVLAALQHGPELLCVLCADASLLVLTQAGERLRQLRAVTALWASDFLGVGHPQLLVARTGFGFGGGAPPAPPRLAGYALIGPTHTWADVAIEGAVEGARLDEGSCGAADARFGEPNGAERAEAARRRQLCTVARALGERLEEGLVALEDARRGVQRRALLQAHAERRLADLAAASAAWGSLLCAAPERATEIEVHAEAAACCGTEVEAEGAAAGVAAGVAAAAAAAADMARRALLRRWYEAEGLVPLATSTVRPAAEAPATKVARAAHVGGGASCCESTVQVQQVRHRLAHGCVLIRLSVRNGAAWPCVHLCGTMLPRGGGGSVGNRCAATPGGGNGGRGSAPPLLVESSCVPELAPRAQEELLLALPLASLGSAAAIEADLLLGWQSPHAASDKWAPACWRWRYELAGPVGVDVAALLRTELGRATAAPPRAPSLPPALQRAAALLLEAPEGSSALRQLPRTLFDALLLEPDADADADAAVFAAPPLVQAQPLPLVCGTGEVRGVGTSIRLGITTVGRCAEVRLVARGPACDAALVAALRLLAAALPDALQPHFCFAAPPVLDALRDAVDALQREATGVVAACERFARARERPLAGANAGVGETSAAVAWIRHQVAALQAATDARFGTLHSIL